MTRSGSVGSSRRDEMHDEIRCRANANLEWKMVVVPLSQGSIRMEKPPCVGLGDGGSCDEVVSERGRKVRRKVESALRCLTVRDMMMMCGIDFELVGCWWCASWVMFPLLLFH